MFGYMCCVLLCSGLVALTFATLWLGRTDNPFRISRIMVMPQFGRRRRDRTSSVTRTEIVIHRELHHLMALIIRIDYTSQATDIREVKRAHPNP